MARRARRPIKFEFKPSWKYVRERLEDPSVCAKGSYRSITNSNVAGAGGPPPGIIIVTCCPKGAKRNTAGQCCTKSSCRSSTVQAIRHDVNRFRFRHKDVWNRLQRATPDARGVRIAWGRTTEAAKKGKVA